ncbi:Phosphatidylinositol N-acetylglucosaminyltransferase subunit C [Fasciola hepatica]|uniref:Phosphatidylinositol N-acetylglucosaminyltransferase subunit C n=1 Tax=Fasciola hepatica TaxID=6192 RepID=A0A4E0RR57_FASHE|nr:Phosphatidylinositol N-acetylglucosaminyltransferase subunit C [Fasciola hepatica]
MTTKQKWEKVLYKDQGAPDNYVDPSFLSELRKNLYIREYHLPMLIVSAGSVYQQFCCIGIFLTIYFYLLFQWISPLRASALLGSTAVIGYLTFWGISTIFRGHIGKVGLELRTGVFIFVFSFLFAPILHSLLATVSTDTIYALSSLFLLANWLFLDYRTHSEEYVYEPGSNTTAISSSLLATLCLASRLPSAHHTFTLLQAWTIIFALWPILVQLIRVCLEWKGQLGITLSVGLVFHLLLCPILYHEAPIELQVWTCVLITVALVVLNFVGPWVLVRMQSMKKNIHGPWDEAVIDS